MALYVCADCGAQYREQVGRCKTCGSFEIIVGDRAQTFSEAAPLGAVRAETQKDRLASVDGLDRVLGGGFLPGFSVLLSGVPGCGKSTLALQALRSPLRMGRKVLYLAGEESKERIRARADRLGFLPEEMNNFFISEEMQLEAIEATISRIRPSLVVCDSAQSLVRGATLALHLRAFGAVCRRYSAAALIVNQTTKDGEAAGPQAALHEVDALLHLEVLQRMDELRLLSCSKNRGGPADEVAFFEMQGAGLVARDIHDLSSAHTDPPAGSVRTFCRLGRRWLVLEIEALYCARDARRVTTQGVNRERCEILRAVLERLGFLEEAGAFYIAIPGGIPVSDSGADLALALAMISAYRGASVRGQSVFYGEIGLSGLLRSTTRITPPPAYTFFSPPSSLLSDTINTVLP